MWIGERITEKGVGNGISIVLVINIISRIPSDFGTLYEQFVKGKIPAKAVLAVVIIAAIILVTVVFVVVLQAAQRKIPVQYSKKIQGRKQVGGQSTHWLGCISCIDYCICILLYIHYIQSAGDCEQHEETGWIYPGYQTWKTNQRLSESDFKLHCLYRCGRLIHCCSYSNLLQWSI